MKKTWKSDQRKEFSNQQVAEKEQNRAVLISHQTPEEDELENTNVPQKGGEEFRKQPNSD